MIKRIRIPGGERYSLPFLTRYYALSAIWFDISQTGANPVNWNYFSFLGNGGGPDICKNGYLYTLPTDGESNSRYKWIDLDSAVLRGYDKMWLDTHETLGLWSGDIYFSVVMVRV